MYELFVMLYILHLRNTSCMFQYYDTVCKQSTSCYCLHIASIRDSMTYFSSSGLFLSPSSKAFAQSMKHECVQVKCICWALCYVGQAILIVEAKIQSKSRRCGRCGEKSSKGENSYPGIFQYFSASHYQKNASHFSVTTPNVISLHFTRK